MSNSNSVHFLVSVWGDNYINDYLSLSLPCQLASKNLPLLATRECYDIHYIIVTDKVGKKAIASHVCFSILKKLVNVSFVDLSSFQQQLTAQRNSWRRFSDDIWYKYALKMACMEYGINQARENKGIFIPLMSDLIMSNGALSYLLHQHEQGKKCVLIGSLKVIKESFLADTNSLFSNQKKTFEIEGNKLIELSLKHLHQWTINNSVSSSNYNNAWPDYVYWVLPDKAVIQSGNYCYPFLMDCSIPIEKTAGFTIDTMPLPYKEEDYHIVSEPEHCMVMVLEDENEPVPDVVKNIVGVFDPISVATFRVHETQAHHRLFSEKNIVFGNKNDELVKQFEEQVKTKTQEVNALHQLLLVSPNINNMLYKRTIINNLGDDWLAYIPNIVEKLTHDSESIIAIGAGTEFQALTYVTSIAPKVQYVVDNNSNLHGKYVDGIQVISFKELSNILTPKDVLLLCSARFNHKLYQQLIDNEMPVDQIVNPYQVVKSKVVGEFK